MFKWMDRVYVNARKKIFKNLDTGEILNLELQDDPDNIVTESETPLTAHCLNLAQQELVDDMSKTYTGTNITADTVAGYGRINKLYGKTTEVGTGEKSPSNPYTLKCVGDDVNLFNKKFRQGAYNSNDSYNRLFSTQSLFLKAGTYTVSTNLDINIFRMVVAIAKSEFPVTDSQDLILDSGWKTQQNYTFTFDTDGYFGIGIAKNSGDNLTTKDIDSYWFKLQKGSVATPYSPYGKGTVENISKNGSNTSSNIVTAKPLCSIGDIRDELDYTNKKIARRCGHKIFNGSEDWWAGISYTNCISFETNITAKYQIPQICSHFKYVNDYHLDEPHMYIYNNIMYVFVSKTIASTVSEFKTWLASNPITVIYGLSTPTTESIDCSDKIVQYAESTNVYNRDGAEIEVEMTNNKAISGLNEEDMLLEEKITKTEDKIPKDEDINKIVSSTKYNHSGISINLINDAIKSKSYGADNPVTSFEDNKFGKINFIGTVTISSKWYFLINIVHDNGTSGDSNLYILQIRKLMTSSGGSLEWRQKVGTTWSSWTTL